MMQPFYKKSLALFLLFLFLFPQAEKEIHRFRHADDTHCAVRGQLHFHQPEHSCSICDYTTGLSNAVKETGFPVILTACATRYLLFAREVILAEPGYPLPLRAPPAV